MVIKKKKKEVLKMSTRLEISKNKLERLKEEQLRAFENASNETKNIPLGQPIFYGRRDIYKNAKRNWEKARKLEEEIKEQEKRVGKMEAVEKFKEDNQLLKDVHIKGNTKYAMIGAKTSVNNLEYFIDKLKKLIELNEKNKSLNKLKNGIKYETFGSEITKLKNKIAYLEQMQTEANKNKNNMNKKTKQLIDNGDVVQWKKKPIYYFVKNVYKVALIINENGEFEISTKYSPKNDNDLEYVKKILSVE